MNDKLLLLLALPPLVWWLIHRLSRKLTLLETVERIKQHGLVHYGLGPYENQGSDFPPDACLRTSQFFSQGLSILYWRTVKEGGVLETLDIATTDRLIYGSRIVVHYVDGKPFARRLLVTTHVVKLTEAEREQAAKLLARVRFGLPENLADDDWAPEFG